MRDLKCDPKTLAGPIDKRVVENLQRRYPLDPVYLECMEACHGGVPRVGTFTVGKKKGQIGLFLTLVDGKSKLKPPKRPHFEDERDDERVVNSVSYLVNGEHSTARALFDKLLPFAALLTGMCLDRGYVDLLCFDYRVPKPRPPVVLWLADKATSAYITWDLLPFAQSYDDNENPINVAWDEFLIPLAPDFSKFIASLRVE
ncbi:MAG: hypothetical protein AB7K24_10120 [Gemmataceae bacterium]